MVWTEKSLERNFGKTLTRLFLYSWGRWGVNTFITHAQQLKGLFIQYFVSLVMIVLQTENHLIFYLQREWKTIVAWFEWNAVLKCIWRALDGAPNKPVALTTHSVGLFQNMMFFTFRSINTRTHLIYLTLQEVNHEISFLMTYSKVSAYSEHLVSLYFSVHVSHSTLQHQINLHLHLTCLKCSTMVGFSPIESQIAVNSSHLSSLISLLHDRPRIPLMPKLSFRVI